ncbi:hypothetical protein [Saliterribacillus persicus]|uniref:Uncharacterized protein n=1 Tax=Saliterribacillus persicus TaxID=930114 RepID=A0A368YB37_9BACI|nr:hypothetical protein [Saliterribacillus persicus]RCW77481.1 hypothetical protein DFR57_101355 [Saliterribacillus persicus]
MNQRAEQKATLHDVLGAIVIVILTLMAFSFIFKIWAALTIIPALIAIAFLIEAIIAYKKKQRLIFSQQLLRSISFSIISLFVLIQYV